MLFISYFRGFQITKPACSKDVFFLSFNIAHNHFSSTTTRSTGRCWNRRPRCRPRVSRAPPTERLSRRQLPADDKLFLLNHDLFENVFAKPEFEKEQKESILIVQLQPLSWVSKHITRISIYLKKVLFWSLKTTHDVRNL